MKTRPAKPSNNGDLPLPTPLRSLLRSIALLAVLIPLAGCSSLEPAYERPRTDLPGTWSVEEASDNQPLPSPEGWDDFIRDQKLRQVVALAKNNSENIALAALRVDRARQQFQISSAKAVPTTDVALAQSRTGSHSSSQAISSTANATVGFTSYEVDLFGKVRSLKRQALQLFLADEQAKRTVENAVVSDVAKRYLTLAADSDLLQIAQSTLRSREEAVRILKARVRAGEGSPLDLMRAQTELAAARDDSISAATELGLAKNALNATVGATVPDELLPRPGTLSTLLSQQQAPVGLGSEVLLTRPDVQSAEAELKAANANIGVARAALFPSIRLTAAAGGASDQLMHLFSDGGRYWSLLPSISIPLFDGGARKANAAVSAIERDMAAARYRDTLQDAFYQVADALTLDSTAEERIVLLRQRRDAAADALKLVSSHYDAGITAYIDVLDAQRTANEARRALVQFCLARETNRVSLFLAIGNGD